MVRNAGSIIRRSRVGQIFVSSKRLAIIGVKGMPPEFLGTSGVEFYVAQRIPVLIKEGVYIDCYVRSWATPLSIKTYRGARLIHITAIATKYFDAVSHSFISTVRAVLSPIDTVWYHASGPSMFSFLPRILGKRVVVTIHTLEWKRKKWNPLAKYVLHMSEWVAAKSATTLVAVSDDIATYLSTTYKREILVDAPLTPTHKRAAPDIIQRKYGLKGHDYVLYLGRFVPEKRVEWLINAYQLIHPKKTRLVLAGGASFSEHYEKTLRRLVGNNENIIFTGWVFGKEKEELMQNCELFVLPSSLEGNPMVLHELPKNTNVLISDVIARGVTHRKSVHTFLSISEPDFIYRFRMLFGSILIK
jgi:glycosyltransferase involved in cell wall biosynthesis